LASTRTRISRFSALAASLLFALVLTGAGQSRGDVVFRQDFEDGLGSNETTSGAFQINNTNLNNGTLMMGHPARYGNNEYSYYEVSLDVTNFDNVQLQFDFNADFETHFDRFNLMAGPCPVDPPNDLLTPISGMTYVTDHVHRPELGTTYFDTRFEKTGTAVFDLSAFDREPNLCVRFQFGSDGSVTDLGINLDDTVVTGVAVNKPPDCSAAVADPGEIWPPNHRMVPIEMLGVADPDGDPIAISVDAVVHNEEGQTLGSGNTSPDATLSPLEVRAERAGQGVGRTYEIDFTAEDGVGGSCTGTVTVCVPLDRSGNGCDDAKVEICHVPPDNPENAHIISVSANAEPPHVTNHGDKVVPEDGTCTVGVGECAVIGSLSCTAAGLVCDSEPSQPPEEVEITCDDGRDNDCDGLIDDADPDCGCTPDPATEVEFDGTCYYLDGSNGVCDPGYALAPQSVLNSIASDFAGKTYRNMQSNNCCIKHANQATEGQDWGMTGSADCNGPGPFINGPVPGGAGCTNANQNYSQQLTLCGSQ
jgi:hypothetical protein